MTAHNLRRDANTFCVFEIDYELGKQLRDGSFNPFDHQIPPHNDVIELTKGQALARFVNNIFCTIELVPQSHRMGFYVIVRRT